MTTMRIIRGSGADHVIDKCERRYLIDSATHGANDDQDLIRQQRLVDYQKQWEKRIGEQHD